MTVSLLVFCCEEELLKRNLFLNSKDPELASSSANTGGRRDGIHVGKICMDR